MSLESSQTWAPGLCGIATKLAQSGYLRRVCRTKCKPFHRWCLIFESRQPPTGRFSRRPDQQARKGVAIKMESTQHFQRRRAPNVLIPRIASFNARVLAPSERGRLLHGYAGFDRWGQYAAAGILHFGRFKQLPRSMLTTRARTPCRVSSS